MNTIIYVDKPRGITSFQAVKKISRQFQVKAGHTGTLDPLATGLLIILTGKRTKEVSSFVKLDKTYEVRGILGIETNTFDSEGTILSRNDKIISRDSMEHVLVGFHGDIWQTPPSFSSKKIKGQRAYQLARQGVHIDLPPHRVSIYSLTLDEFQFPYFTLTCDVSSGFYVRSLVHDIGQSLGVGSTVLEVRRLRIGPYTVKQARSLTEILALPKRELHHDV